MTFLAFLASWWFLWFLVAVWFVLAWIADRWPEEDDVDALIRRERYE